MEGGNVNQHRSQSSDVGPYKARVSDEAPRLEHACTFGLYGYMHSFRQAMEEGRVRTDSAADFNTLARLKAFLEGKADSRQEVQGVITLEQMQDARAPPRAAGAARIAGPGGHRRTAAS
jgi:hypothetical protein